LFSMRARRHAKAGKRKLTVTVTIIRPGRCTLGATDPQMAAAAAHGVRIFRQRPEECRA
jgi:hypothetical protein